LCRIKGERLDLGEEGKSGFEQSSWLLAWDENAVFFVVNSSPVQATLLFRYIDLETRQDFQFVLFLKAKWDSFTSY
jgi:hypothetical protein